MKLVGTYKTSCRYQRTQFDSQILNHERGTNQTTDLYPKQQIKLTSRLVLTSTLQFLSSFIEQFQTLDVLFSLFFLYTFPSGSTNNLLGSPDLSL